MCNVVRDFNTSLLITEKEQTKKVGKHIKDLNNVIKKLGLVGIGRRQHFTIIEYILFSSTERTFAKIYSGP